MRKSMSPRIPLARRISSDLAFAQTAAQFLSKYLLAVEHAFIQNEHVGRNVLPGTANEFGLMLHLARSDAGYALRKVFHHRGAFCEEFDSRRAHVALHETSSWPRTERRYLPKCKVLSGSLNWP